MKRIGVTQRVDHIQSYGEYRSALDLRWIDFALVLDHFPIPFPIVDPASIDGLFEALNLDAILLSGGNSLSALDSEADDASPQRDSFEIALIEGALARQLPIVGVCRGMQLLNHYFGGELVRIENHVAVNHGLESLKVDGANVKYSFPLVVNSFHAWTIPPEGLAAELSPLAVDCDGNIEAYENQCKRVLGLMWHPEREAPFAREDINLIKVFLK